MEGATKVSNLRPSGTIRLLGKADLLQVFEALQPGDIGTDVMKLYVEAYEAMRSGDTKAEDLFSKLAEVAPDDQLIGFHFRRLQAGASDDNVSLEVK